MSRVRWFRTTAAALVVSAFTFGAALPVQATPASDAAKESTVAPAAATAASMIGKGQPVTATKATTEEIRAMAANGNGTLFTVDKGGPSASLSILCVLTVSPPLGGGSPGASVRVDSAVQCNDWVDFLSVYVELWRDLGQVARNAAAVPFSPVLYVSATESSCRNGIYWGVGTAYARRSGFTPPSVYAHGHGVPLPVGCGSAPPPPPPPPTGTVTVTNPGNQFGYKWQSVSLQMQASGGTTYAWSANGLPPGVNINPSTGRITGNPSALGTYSVTVTAVAGVGKSGFTAFSWTVIGEPCPRC